MPMTPERAAAHDQMDAAVQSMIDAYGLFDHGQFLLGWNLLIGGTRMLDPELDAEFFDPDDGCEEEFATTTHSFTKRGQQPAVTRGLLEYHVDSMIRSQR